MLGSGEGPVAQPRDLSSLPGLLPQPRGAGDLAAPGPTYLGNLGKLPKAGVPDAGDIQKLHLLGGAQGERGEMWT